MFYCMLYMEDKIFKRIWPYMGMQSSCSWDYRIVLTCYPEGGHVTWLLSPESSLVVPVIRLLH